MVASAGLEASRALRKPVRLPSRRRTRRGPPHLQVDFPHPSEFEFARLLDYYRVRWAYEPVAFPLRWEGTETREMFTPDFYLVDHEVFVELTTMRQSLVTPKNRKLRRLRELYPSVNVRLLYRRDYNRLLAQGAPLAGTEPVDGFRAEVPELGRVLHSAEAIQARVRELGRQISHDYAGRDLLLVGVLKGGAVLMADLARHLSVGVEIDYVALSKYRRDVWDQGEAGPSPKVRIVRDLDASVKGRHVLLIDDVVNTGLTLDFLLRRLRSREPASLAVAALIDRADSRLVDVPLRYAAFPGGPEFAVGYGLGYRDRHRQLPHILELVPDDRIEV